MSDKTIGSADIAAIEDLIGNEFFLNGLEKFVKECATPMTIAVQGDWGVGKTSVMKQLKKQLDDDESLTLWFNTWQFSVLGEQDRLLIDLLEVLCNSVKNEIENKELKENEKINDKLNKFQKTLNKISASFKGIKWKRVGKATFAGLSALYSEAIESLKETSGIDVPDLKSVLTAIIEKLDEEESEESAEIKDEYIPDYQSYALLVLELYNNLGELIKEITANYKKIYIFIDDLDRLSPIKAVELLEGIKNFIDFEKCVFILAIDNNVIEKGILQKYGEQIDPQKATQFMEKIVQIPFTIPSYNYDYKEYLKELLEDYLDSTINDIELNKYADVLKHFDNITPRILKRCINLCKLQKCMENLCGDPLTSFKLKLVELLYNEKYEKLKHIIVRYKNFDNAKDQLIKELKMADITSDEEDVFTENEAEVVFKIISNTTNGFIPRRSEKENALFIIEIKDHIVELLKKANLINKIEDDLEKSSKNDYILLIDRDSKKSLSIMIINSIINIYNLKSSINKDLENDLKIEIISNSETSTLFELIFSGIENEKIEEKYFLYEKDNRDNPIQAEYKKGKNSSAQFEEKYTIIVKKISEENKQILKKIFDNIYRIHEPSLLVQH